MIYATIDNNASTVFTTTSLSTPSGTPSAMLNGSTATSNITTPSSSLMMRNNNHNSNHCRNPQTLFPSDIVVIGKNHKQASSLPHKKHQRNSARHYASAARNSHEFWSRTSSATASTTTTTARKQGNRNHIGNRRNHHRNELHSKLIVSPVMPKIEIQPPTPTDDVEQFGWGDFPIVRRCAVAVKPAIILPPPSNHQERMV